jgi:hypothetical protein
MYARGDLRFWVTEEEANADPNAPLVQEDGVDDARNSGELRPPFAALPHSCGYWVIGGPEELLLLAADAMAAAAQIMRKKQKEATH